MTPERLHALVRKGASLDTETHLLQAGLLAPPVVCLAWAWIDPTTGRMRTHLGDKDDAPMLFGEIIDDPESVLVLANAPFDMGVMAVRLARMGIDAMPWIFEAYAIGRVFDVLVQEALHAIAEGTLNKDPRTNGALINPETGKRGRYSLATTVDLVLGRKDAKVNDEFRFRYHELDGIPIAQWPPQAVQYPQDDVRNTYEVALAQAGIIPRAGAQHDWVADSRYAGAPGYISTCRHCGQVLTTNTGKVPECKPRAIASRNLCDLSNQVYTHWAMHLGAMHGFMVDQRNVDIVAAEASRGKEAAAQPFVEAGLFRADGSQDLAATKKRVALAYGAHTPCPVCQGTGKVPSPKNPKSKINCCRWDEAERDAKGEPIKVKTCDGTGLLLEEADVPRSDKDGVGYGRDVLHESGADLLIGLAEHQEDAKVLNVYVPFLRRGRQPIAGHAEGCALRTSDKGECACEGPYRDIPLTLWPNVLLETGRTSYGGVIQLLPRAPGRKNELGEYVPSLRECFVARPGKVLVSVDYEGGELVTWAQACLYAVGHSDLATALNTGVKPHNALSATMLGMSYEEYQQRYKAKDQLCVDTRTAAKWGGFGYQGGMGPAKLVITCRKQGADTPCPNGPHWVTDESTGRLVRGYKGTRFCIFMDKAERCGEVKVTEWNDRKISPTCRRCIECAARIRASWYRQWSEAKPYFDFVSECIDEGMLITGEMLDWWPHLKPWFARDQRLAPGEVMQFVSGRVRGGVEYSSCANGFFQGLLSDLAKHALRCTSRECYDHTVRVGGAPSPLLGSRVIVFQHDELIAEVPEECMHEAATRISTIMCDAMKEYCPDLAPAVVAEPAIMRRWDKRAATVRDGNGRLQVWEPK